MTLAQDRQTTPAPAQAPATTLARPLTRPTRPAGPPPRPQLTSDVVPPWLQPTSERRPRAVWTGACLALLAIAAGLAALAAMAADGDGLRARLTAVATEGDPTASEALIRSGVRTTLLVVVGAQLVLALLAVLWLVLLLRRRSWARWAFVGTAVGILGVAALAQDVVAGGPELDRLGFVVEAGALVLTVAVLLSRGVGAWLRESTD